MRCPWTIRVLLLLLVPVSVTGQEESSADLFTESYTDEFQEAFFEALKQKGIENYDRSEAFMLEARKYNPDDPVVDYELARILILAEQYNRAESFALEALKARPSEYWYADTFMQTLKYQSRTLEKGYPDLPVDLPEFRLNLARWYIKEGNFKEARAQLAPIKGQEEAERLLQEVGRLESMQNPEKSLQPSPVRKAPSEDSRSIASYEARMEVFLEQANWNSLEKESSEALESFPLQPSFYYYKGMALMRQGRAEQALSVLKEGEGFLLGPSTVGQRLYGAISEAYTALGDMEKAKQYTDKMKTGL